MTASGPYSRIYHSVKDDERFAHVYPCDECWSLWSRLLIEADAAYPSPAPIPRSARKRPLAQLVKDGLVELLPHDLYRIHGMKAERDQRSESGRSGGIASGRSRAPKAIVERTPQQPLNGQPERNEREETRRDEKNKTETSSARLEVVDGLGTEDAEWPVMVWLANQKAFIEPNGGRLHQRVSRLVDKHGAQKVIRTMAELGEGLEANQYVLGADNALNPIPSARRLSPAEQKAQEIADARAAAQRKMAVNAG